MVLTSVGVFALRRFSDADFVSLLLRKNPQGRGKLRSASSLDSHCAGDRTFTSSTRVWHGFLAQALTVWFVAVLLYDIAVLGTASLLRSGTASRVLITAALINPVDAARTATLTLIEGSGAFGAASLALLRLTGGVAATVTLAVASLAAWTIVPLLLAVRTLARADI